MSGDHDTTPTDRAPGVPEVQRLHRKYVTLVGLHATRQARQDAGFDRFDAITSAERRRTFRGLALEFPGALRELEALPLAELERRRDELARWLEERSPAPLPRWALAAIHFHATLSQAIRARTGGDTSTRDGPWTAPLGEGGRLLDRVWDLVARTLGTTPGDAERLVYPSAPARGTRTRPPSD